MRFHHLILAASALLAQAALAQTASNGTVRLTSPSTSQTAVVKVGTPLSSDPAVVVVLSPNSAQPAAKPTVQQSQVVDEKGHVGAVKGPGQATTAQDQAQVVAISPTPAPTCTSLAAISQTANTKLVAGLSGKRIFICSFLLVSATAQTVALTEGTGTTCGTAALALVGSTTVANGPSLAANGGWAQAAASPFMVSQVLGDDLCLLQSGAGNVSGSITYTQF